MRARAIAFAWVLAGTLAAVACTLNPQPLPPGSGGEDTAGSGADAAANPAPHDGAGGGDASFAGDSGGQNGNDGGFTTTDGAPPEAGAIDGSGDAGSDALDDAPLLDATDAALD
jgi:hypothetical protein